MSAHRILKDLYWATLLPMADPGAGGTIEVDRQLAVVPVETAGAEARTLAQPTKAGLLAAICLKTDGGDLTLTVTGGYNQAGATSIVFGDAGDFVLLYSVQAGASYYWRVLAYEGVNVTLTEQTVTTLTVGGAMTTSRGTVAAAGSTQGDATAVEADVDNVVVTGADGTKGVKLPVATAGRRIFVKNAAAAILKVYPNTDAAINAIAANGALDMAANTAALFVADSASQWYTCPLVPS